MVKPLNRNNQGNTKRLVELGGLNKTSGLTLIELAVVIVCVFVIVVLILPALPTRPVHAERAACESNLKQVGIAFRTWEGDYGNKYPMSVSTNKGGSMEFGAGSEMFKHFQVMSNELYNPKVILCPSDDRHLVTSSVAADGSTYLDFANLSNRNISYFVGLDADETRPTMLLSGDRNLVFNNTDVPPGLVALKTNDIVGWSTKMHNRMGNIGLADGSVQSGSSQILQTFLNHTGTNMNRLAVP